MAVSEPMGALGSNVSAASAPFVTAGGTTNWIGHTHTPGTYTSASQLISNTNQ